RLCGTNYPLSIAFIVVNEFCERFSYYGMKAVLTLYFINFLHWDKDLSTAVYHAFSSLCYFTPLFGALIADSFLGKFKTIIYLSIVYVTGHIIKSVGAIPTVGDQTMHAVLSMVGLVLIALGTGGIKPCVAAFGGDQFEEKHVDEKRKFFSIFYLSINAGSVISTFVIPLLRGNVQCFGGDCYALAFGVPAALMAVALVLIFQYILHYTSIHWRKSLITEIKMVSRVLFLYIPLPMFWALFDQQGTRWTLQAARMNMDFTLNALLILIFIPVFDMGLYPLVGLCNIKFTFINGHSENVNITVGEEDFGAVLTGCDISPYRTLERGEHTWLVSAALHYSASDLEVETGWVSGDSGAVSLSGPSQYEGGPPGCLADDRGFRECDCADCSSGSSAGTVGRVCSVFLSPVWGLYHLLNHGVFLHLRGPGGAREQDKREEKEKAKKKEKELGYQELDAFINS
ncbi:UNVERIFIED_CONTAM: hypothetical protein FKN15_048075, partial [Acipenser sinensis]